MVRFWETPYCNNKWLIEGIEVIPPNRRNGIGRSMVQYGVEILRKNGVKEVSANIRIDRNRYNEGIWSLYEEGFAQFFQYKLLDKEIDSRGIEWFEICKINETQLKKLYLRALFDEEEGTKDFFGDWFEVLGISDAGYYLGAEFIRMMDTQHNIEYIAKLSFEEIENQVVKFLNS